MGWGSGVGNILNQGAGSVLSNGLPAIPGITPGMVSGQLGQAGASGVLNNTMGATGGGGGILSGIGSALGSAIPIVGQVGSILQGINGIASLFKTSPQGMAKEDATANQQRMEQWMKDIETQVSQGTMSVDAGMAAIAQIMQSASMGDSVGGGAGTAASNMVKAMGAQILSNLASKRDWQLQASVKDPGAMDRIMSGNQPGGESFQRARMATLGRNALMGTQLGKDLKDVGSPLGNIGNMGPMYGSSVNKTLGELPGQYAKLNPGVGQAGDVLKKKLGVYGGV